MQPLNATSLNGIETSWSLVGRAHNAATQSAAQARHHLFERYSGAVWRYFLAATRDESTAEELFQDFALRLMRGDFRRATPDRGRFRDYLKTVVINLLNDYHRKRAQQPVSLPDQVASPPTACTDSDERDVFLSSWREELLRLTWSHLESSNAALHEVLRVHVRHPDLPAAEKGEIVAERIGTDFTANRFRVMLHRARVKFAQLLKHEVIESLNDPTEEELETELRRLRLSDYCRT